MRGGGYLAEEAQPAPHGYPYRWERSGTQEIPAGRRPGGPWTAARTAGVTGGTERRTSGRRRDGSRNHRTASGGVAARDRRTGPRPVQAGRAGPVVLPAAGCPGHGGCLWPWAAAWAAVWTMQAGQSWHYFAQGGQLLLGAGPGTPFQLYAAHPDLQIGPLALVVSALTQLLGAHAAEIVALTAMSLTGPLVLAGVWRLLPGEERPRRFRLLLAGLVFLPVWSELTTHFGHLDDLLALCFSVAAMHAVARRHPVWAGLAIAAAADCQAVGRRLRAAAAGPAAPAMADRPGRVHRRPSRGVAAVPARRPEDAGGGPVHDPERPVLRAARAGCHGATDSLVGPLGPAGPGHCGRLPGRCGAAGGRRCR